VNDQPSDLPPALEKLRGDFARVADEEVGRRTTRRLRRTGALAAAFLCVGVAAAGAAGVVITRGEPIAEAPVGDLPADLRPRPETAQLDSVRVPDPVGGLPWGVRLSISETGQRCYAIGLVMDGEIGRVVSGQFHTLPLRGPGRCADLTRGPYSIGVSQRPGADGADRTIVAGLAGSATAHFEVTMTGQRQRLEPSPNGVFLAVYGPAVRPQELEIAAVFTDGRRDPVPLSTGG
jgi:hypothetical protein